MNTRMIIAILFVTSLEQVFSRRKLTDWNTGFLCHSKCPEFNCACEEENWAIADRRCIPFTWLCDAAQDCSNRADEIDCICPPDQHQCGSDRGGNVERLSDVYNCIDKALIDNSKRDCWSGSDETIDCQQAIQCDGYIECQNGTDEMNCPQCPLHLPFSCNCDKLDGFKCGIGKSCYDDGEKCDGIIHCSDGSDEEGCNACNDEQFTCDCQETLSQSCSIGGCISASQQCDGKVDCSDGSDEENCATCRNDMFTCDCYMTDPRSCSNRGCVMMSAQCDGQLDCSDGSDEKGCVCKDDQFTCDCYKTYLKSCSRRGCVSLSDHCDGYAYCSDGSDEEGCSCKDNQFTCDCYKVDPQSCSRSGCVSISQQCNGEFDCSDGSDEEGCSCKDGEFTCDCYKTDPKSCSYKGCVLISAQCDGILDCSDGSDEEGCTCKDDQFICNCYKTNPKTCSGRGCISMRWVCNEDSDCSDGSDEENYSPTSCKKDQFQCSCDQSDPMLCSGIRCISMNWLCDGDLDCSDGSDEKDCRPTTCTNDQFKCSCDQTDPRLCSGIRCISKNWLCDGDVDCSDGSDEKDCTCSDSQFTCDCYKNGTKPCSTEGCISMNWLCDGDLDCSDGSDERGCTCNDGEFTCDCYKNDIKSYSSRGCFLMSYRCDAVMDCSDGSDEEDCSCKEEEFTCDCYKTDPKSCSNRGCFPMSLHCDRSLQCSDGSDEKGCSCKDEEFVCNCYKTDPVTCSVGGCVSMVRHCDGYLDCSDGSDEEGCICGGDQFTCDCYRTFHKYCSRNGCIWNYQFLNGYQDCEDGSDEPKEYFTRTTCEDFDVIIRRFSSVLECDVYTDCESSSCFIVPALNCSGNFKCNASQVICTSSSNEANGNQSCNSIFQCANGQLEIADNFCDGKFDCFDRSDEVGNQPGFKCSASFGRCVLPQRNLLDGVAQCKDGSDLCSDIPCFECLDRRLIISQNQLCDGIIDCFDLSDECLCEVHFRNPICQEMFVLNDSHQLQCTISNSQCNYITSSLIETAQYQFQVGYQSNVTINSKLLPSHVRCQNKSGEIKAVTCDGRPECKDFSDECSCENPPTFCSDHCHNFYPIGDRYCDGIIDEAWKFINDSSCPVGFDEKSCPQRFVCKAGNLVNIDVEQLCDGKVDCNDGSDELSCNTNFRETIFSSQTEMIASDALRGIFWFMSLLVVIGNSLVIFLTTRLLYMEKMSESQTLNHVLMTNLSISDLLMGIYLLIISVKSLQFSGFYGDIDYQWRTSLECSIIGSLAVISSETSCFIMTILSAFRLYNVFNPFTARTASTLKWKLVIVLAWSISLVLALLPVLKKNSNYFAHEVWFSNPFTSSEGWKRNDVMTFACRLASLSNKSIENTGDAWESTRNFLRNIFPEYSPLGEVGYYGETSVCMPRIYATNGEQTLLYSLVVMTFNFISFLFVATCYVLIYYKASYRPIQTSRTDEKTAQMQRRIARLIGTDFVCWIPICIMVYLTAGGVEISNLTYIVTAGVLLPINSALNPLLYSPIIENYFCKLCCKKNKNDPQGIQLRRLN